MKECSSAVCLSKILCTNRTCSIGANNEVDHYDSNASANHWFPYSSLELLKQVAKEVKNAKVQ
jgi:hypothetical protein